MSGRGGNFYVVEHFSHILVRRVTFKEEDKSTMLARRDRHIQAPREFYEAILKGKSILCFPFFEIPGRARAGPRPEPGP